ncbi:MAG TPA: hypothetical protein VGO92_04935 [Acidimicrobiales bacterium]|jgi:hypothetical protein|nr:hypothetical protein [Acidimicrobiales bacterium]
MRANDGGERDQGRFWVEVKLDLAASLPHRRSTLHVLAQALLDALPPWALAVLALACSGFVLVAAGRSLLR